MRHTYRIRFSSNTRIDTTAASVTEACANVKDLDEGEIVSVEVLKPDLITCSTPLKDSPYTLRKMTSGKLYLVHAGLEPDDVSNCKVMQAVDNHIQFLECHIHELNLKIEAQKQSIYEFVRDQVNNEIVKQIQELCGYVENGTDTVVKIFQDDATKDWCVTVGITRGQNNCYISSSIIQAIKLAYDACKEKSDDQ
jgi:hypothetical protein